MQRKSFKGKLDRVVHGDDVRTDVGETDGERGGRRRDAGTRRLNAARDIPVDRIRPDPNQPRTSYRKEGLEALAETIRAVGVINPIQVRYLAGEDLFEIISGERRYRAAVLAGLGSVPCIIRESGDEERRAHQIIENVHREDFNAIDRARALLELKQTLGPRTPWKKVEEMTGISERRRQQFLILLDLPEHMQEAILHRRETAWGGILTEKHARALVTLRDDPDEQEILFQKLLTGTEPFSGDRALSRARLVKNRTEPHLSITIRFRDQKDLIRQLEEKLKALTGKSDP